MGKSKRKRLKVVLNIPNDIKVLAIDPASKLGWAIDRMKYGVWDLRTRKDESMGMKLIRMEAKLQELFEMEHFNLLIYERPGGRNKLPIIHQSKMIGVMEQWCEKNGVQYRSYSATEIKKFATGKGNAGKPAMILAAQKKLGYTGEDDNEADAMWLLELCKFELNIQ
jgi:Holliday junction resolvasome RuvABC endonuclease subunit